MTFDSHPDPSIQALPEVLPEAPTRLARLAQHEPHSTFSLFSSLSTMERQKRESFVMSGSVFLITSTGETISLPIPSESDHDPLNWSTRKRSLVFLIISLTIFTGVASIQGMTSSVNGVAIEFARENIAPFTFSSVISFPSVFVAIGALIWIPLTLAIGRRPVYVIATFLNFFACIGAAFSRTFFGLLASMCLAGLSEGFGLSVLFLIIVDMTFIHQRPAAIGLLWSINGGLAALTLSIIPFLTDRGVHWRRYYYLWSFLTGFVSLMVLFLFPETYFKRPAVAYDGRTFVQTATERVAIYDDTETYYNKELPEPPSRSWKQALAEKFHITRASYTSWNSMLFCYAQIFFCFLNPLIFVAWIMLGINFTSDMFIGSSISLVLSFPPYMLTANQAVVVNISAAIGYFLGCPFGTIVLSRILNYLARRNKGVREAEHYLVGYFLPIITGALGIMLYGFAVDRKWHYGIHCLAWGLTSFSYAAVAITTLLWTTEAFPRWAAPALAVVAIGMFSTAFGMSSAFEPWIVAEGFLRVGLELMAAQIVTGLIIVPAVFWGKGLRQRIHERFAERREGALRPL